MPDINNLQYQSDLTFGLSEEVKIKNILEEKFGELIQLDKYNPFDFENDNYLIELKSRRNAHNKYDTTMVNYSKLQKTNDTEKTRLIVFNYTDGIYIWIVESDQFTLGRGGRNDRGISEYHTMAYIDIENLKPLSDF
jgi:hypothetical protein